MEEVTSTQDTAQQHIEQPPVVASPPPVADEHPVAADMVDSTPKTDDKPNTVEPPLKEPTDAAKADPTIMNDETDEDSTHVPPPDGTEDPGTDHSFDNRNSQARSTHSTSNDVSGLHAGNGMAAGIESPDAEFHKTFGMPRDAHDPHRSALPPGQVNSVSIKDAVSTPALATPVAGDLTGFSTEREPNLYPVQEKRSVELRYMVAINPTNLPGAKSVPFNNGSHFMDVPVGREVEVSEPIYHAIKDSSIPFTARPI